MKIVLYAVRNEYVTTPQSGVLFGIKLVALVNKFGVAV
jgi:hypothetical protein